MSRVLFLGNTTGRVPQRYERPPVAQASGKAGTRGSLGALRHTDLPAIANRVVFDGIVVDFQKVEVIQNGASVVLTAHEFKTLQFFVQNPDRIITRAELLKEVCGYEDGYTASRSIDNHILQLRHKLENDPRCPSHFRTVTRVGYRFTF
jgi:DNA-binding response OmpR family regulator